MSSEKAIMIFLTCEILSVLFISLKQQNGIKRFKPEESLKALRDPQMRVIMQHQCCRMSSPIINSLYNASGHKFQTINESGEIQFFD